MSGLAWFVACPDCCDKEGPYLCHGPIVSTSDRGVITIRNHAGGVFDGAGLTPEDALQRHRERHADDVHRARARLTALRRALRRAAGLTLPLRTIEVSDDHRGEAWNR